LGPNGSYGNDILNQHLSPFIASVAWQSHEPHIKTDCRAVLAMAN
ncbi:MAG: hypothetical protein ACI9KN_001743, partial [Gammaproteobacteria bacterium]